MKATSTQTELPRNVQGPDPTRTVAVIGGGLAGLAATVALATRGFSVTLFEARRQLGGRAASFRDPATDLQVDHCQHVSLGCCTNLADFARRAGISDLFRRDRRLHFIGPDGRRFDLAASPLPAPLHLLPGLLRLRILTLSERIRIIRALLKLSGPPPHDDRETMLDWLTRHGQSPQAIERFWSVVLVSALSETVERMGVRYARKVFVDGFMANRAGYELEVPRVPLSELYGQRLTAWLEQNRVQLELGASVARLEGGPEGVSELVLRDGSRRSFDYYVAAVTWRRCREMIGPELGATMPELSRIDRIQQAPITAVHLWLDRSVTDLPHAVVVGRLAQWIFCHGEQSVALTNASEDDSSPSDQPRMGHYYQVVVSASRNLAGRDKADVVREVFEDLAIIWPAARETRLLRSRVVTDQKAVFSVAPQIDQLRPAQRTAVPNLALAGDWTRTDWPSTMESAVRSGYLAAEVVLQAAGRPDQVLVEDLPRGLLSRCFLRRGGTRSTVDRSSREANRTNPPISR